MVSKEAYTESREAQVDSTAERAKKPEEQSCTGVETEQTEGL